MKKAFAKLFTLILACVNIGYVSASPSWLPPSQTNGVFTDIQGYEYNNAIIQLKSLGIISGYDDGTYKPYDKINRAEFIKIIIESVSKNQKSCTISDECNTDDPKYKNCFNDVKEEWFAKYICYAKEKGIVSGYENNNFKPSQNIIYVEALKILYEAYKDKGMTEQTSQWYSKYLSDAEKNKIALNEFKNKLSDVITRGELAEMVWRYIDTKN